MPSKRFAIASVGIALVAATAAYRNCASTGDEVGTTSITAASIPPPGSCPADVAGTTVTTTASDGAVALDFATSGDVAALRVRVRGMSELNNRNPGEMRLAAGNLGGVVTLPQASASVEDRPDGARLIVRPADPAQLGVLQRDAPEWADRLASGQCPSLGPRPVQAAPRMAPQEVPVNHDILTPPPFTPAR